MSKNIAIHLGAHKTASTYITSQFLDKPQVYTSKNVKPIFKKNDISALIPGELRQQGGVTQGIAKLTYGNEFSKPLYDKVAQNLQNLIKGIPQNNILLSEENFIGTCRDVIARDHFYYNSAKSLELIKQMLNGHNVSIFIAIRETSSFITSSYCEATRGGHFTNFRNYIRNLDQFDTLWYDLLKRIKSTFNECPIYVWDYKSTFDQKFITSLFSKLFQHAKGLDFFDRLELTNTIVNPSMDAKAFKLLDVAGPVCSREELLQLKTFLDKKMQWTNKDKFCEWSPIEIEYISSQYLKDIDRIKRDDDLNFLE